MAFSTVTPRLFQATMQQPDTNATGAFNIGAKLAELRNQNDPGQQFITGLKARLAEDAKARQAQDLFNAVNNSIPEDRRVNFNAGKTDSNGVALKPNYNYAQGGLSALLGGRQSPDLSAIKDIATINNSYDLTSIKNMLAAQKAKGAAGLGDASIDTSTPEGKASFLASIKDPRQRAAVKAFSEGNLNGTDLGGFGDDKEAIMNAGLFLAGEDYNTGNYYARKSAGRSAGSTSRGSMGANILSAQTLVNHLGFLNDSIGALGNTELPAANVMLNFAKTQLGHPEITDVNQAFAVVDSELETFLKGVGTTEQGLEIRRKMANPNLSMRQLKGVISDIAHIMKGRSDPLQARADKLLGVGNPLGQVFDENQISTLEKLMDTGGSTSGGATGRVSVIDPQGRRGTISASSLQSAIAKGYRQV